VLAGVGEGVELLHRQRVHVGAQADGARAVPFLTMPTTPVVPRPRCTGMPHSVSLAATTSAVRFSSKHSSGWAWMSRRTAAMRGLGDDGVEDLHGESFW
jgi:hypothetical protein